MTSDPFELAAPRAAGKGACPAWEPGDPHADHDTFDVPCPQFSCAGRAATPEEMGLGDWEPPSGPGGDHEIPF